MRRIVVLVFGVVVLQAVPASATPDVLRQGTCSDGAKSRLELTKVGQHPVQNRIDVRFEVNRSPVGHSWRIVIRHGGGPIPSPPSVLFRGTRVASDTGDLVVQRRTWDLAGPDEFEAKAVDTQTGQVCRAFARVW